MYCANPKIFAQKGLTLIELLIAIAIAAIILALAVPSFSLLIERKNLEGATEKMFADFQFARSEAIKRNARVYVSFKQGVTPQCYGISVGAQCDCSASPTDCTLDGVDRIVTMNDFGGTSFDDNLAFGSTFTYFDPVRGINANKGNIEFTSPSGLKTRTVLSDLRNKICSPTGAGVKVFTYEDCP